MRNAYSVWSRNIVWYASAVLIQVTLLRCVTTLAHFTSSSDTLGVRVNILTPDSRMVGAALKFLKNDRVPWHRVVRADGSIAERGDGGAGASRQAQRLMSEGVPVSEIPLGSAVTQWRVQSMASNSGYGWCMYHSANQSSYDVIAPADGCCATKSCTSWRSTVCT